MPVSLDDLHWTGYDCHRRLLLVDGDDKDWWRSHPDHGVVVAGRSEFTVGWSRSWRGCWSDLGWFVGDIDSGRDRPKAALCFGEGNDEAEGE